MNYDEGAPGYLEIIIKLENAECDSYDEDARIKEEPMDCDVKVNNDLY